MKSLQKHVRIVLIYVLVAALWILVTDYVIVRLTVNPELLIQLETYKGIIFVFISAALLYVERKKSGNALNKNEEKYRILSDYTYDWEYWLNLEGQFEYISPSCHRISGYTASEFLGDPKLLNRIVHPDDQRIFVNHTEEERIEALPASVEFRIIRRDGKLCWVGHVCQKVFDRRHNCLGIRASNRDITQRKKYQEEEKMRLEELAHADKMITLGTLVSGVAHEINNPTNFITLNTPLLRESWHGSRSILDDYYQQNGDFNVGRFKYSLLRNKVDQLLDGISEGAKRIQRIVTSLKDYARPDPSEMNQSVEINKVLQNAVTLLHSSINKKTDLFETSLEESMPVVYGSEQKIEQVIINLIQNALESLSDSNKVIKMSSHFSTADNKIVIEVEDNGSGMSEEILLRILDPFFTTKRSTGGTGLGLPIANNIVQDHGGSLSFASSVGKGTKATLSLPSIQYQNTTDT